MNIGVEIEGLDELVRRFRRAPQVLHRYMRWFMNQALPLIEREVKLNFSKPRPGGRYKVNNTGAHRSSVTHEVRGMGAEMQGLVGSPLATMPFVELDTRPHWPPRDAIVYWAKRKLGLSGSELQAAARRVQCKISRAGTTGAHVFERAFESTQEQVRRMWVKVWGEAVTREL